MYWNIIIDDTRHLNSAPTMNDISTIQYDKYYGQQRSMYVDITHEIKSSKNQLQKMIG